MIWQKIRAYMEENGIKQSMLVKKTSMTKQSVSESLRGNRQLSADEYVAICAALGVSPEKFTKVEKDQERR